MNLFKAALNNVATGVGNYISQYSKEDTLRDQLHKCSYSDDVKFAIEKAVKQVFHVYPYFEICFKCNIAENGKPKRFLEIKGIMQIQIRGNICKVDYNMMLPSTYPQKAPYVRIINKEASNIVSPMYQPLQSPNDPKSYILNEKLKSIKQWNYSSSLVNIIIESQNLMRNNFPFSKPSKNPGFNSGGWGMPESNSPWQNNQMHGNQGYNQYGHQQPQQQQQAGFIQPNYPMGGNMGRQPPIPFQGGGLQGRNTAQVIAEGQKFIGSSKKVIQKLKTEHLKSIEKVQVLETFQLSLASEQEYIRKQNQKIIEFLRESQNSSMNFDLAQLVYPANQRSEQILSLTCSLKAHDDCIQLLEAKFNDGEITYEQFMKMVRKMEQQKFEDKVILTKCIECSKQ